MPKKRICQDTKNHPLNGGQEVRSLILFHYEIVHGGYGIVMYGNVNVVFRVVKDKKRRPETLEFLLVSEFL